MNFDITFCDNMNCNNLKCERNQKHIPKIEWLNGREIWAGKFPNCKYYKEEK